MLAILLLGAASGLPNPVFGSIHAGRGSPDLGVQQHDRSACCMYVALPYLLKPLWAPLLDRYACPGSAGGAAGSWMLLPAVCLRRRSIWRWRLSAAQHQLTAIAAVLLVIVFLSASTGHRHRRVPHRVAQPAELRHRVRGMSQSRYRASSWGALAVALIVADHVRLDAPHSSLRGLRTAPSMLTATALGAEPDDPRGNDAADLAGVGDSIAGRSWNCSACPALVALVVLILLLQDRRRVRAEVLHRLPAQRSGFHQDEIAPGA